MKTKIIQIIALWVAVVLTLALVIGIPYGIWTLLTALGAPLILTGIGTLIFAFATYISISYGCDTWND